MTKKKMAKQVETFLTGSPVLDAKREGELIAAAKRKAKAGGMLGAQSAGTNNTGGSLSVTSTPDTTTINCPAGATLCFANSDNSASPVLINVDTCHNDTDFGYIEVGKTRHYVVRVANPVVTFKTTSGTATLYGEIVVMPSGTGNR